MVTSFSLPVRLKRTIPSNHLQSSSCELLRLLSANMLTSKVFALSFNLQADSTLVFLTSCMWPNHGQPALQKA